MIEFKVECPIERCDFETKSSCQNVAKGSVIVHIYGTDGNGLRPKESPPPPHGFEVKVKKVGEGRLSSRSEDPGKGRD